MPRPLFGLEYARIDSPGLVRHDGVAGTAVQLRLPAIRPLNLSAYEHGAEDVADMVARDSLSRATKGLISFPLLVVLSAACLPALLGNPTETQGAAGLREVRLGRVHGGAAMDGAQQRRRWRALSPIPCSLAAFLLHHLLVKAYWMPFICAKKAWFLSCSAACPPLLPITWCAGWPAAPSPHPARWRPPLA